MKLESRILGLTCRVFGRSFLVVGVVSRWLLVEGVIIFLAKSPSDVVRRIRESRHYSQINLVIADGCLLKWLGSLRAEMGRPVASLADVPDRVRPAASFSIRVARRIAVIDGIEVFLEGR